MAKLSRKVGATSQIFQVFIQDSSSTTGAGLTGLVFNTASLTAYYHRDTDTTATAISLVTMTSGTFTSSGFVQVDATNMPGVYQFCPPNAALASGASSCVIMLKGATNMAPLVLEIDLDAQVDVTFWNGTVVATPATAGIPDVNVKNINNAAAATPGAAGGVQIAGTNAATTYASLTVTGSTTMSDGLLVSRSTSNTSAITATGNGTGSGAVFTSGSGATGDGIKATAASTNGSGMTLTKTGTGSDFNATVTPLVLAKTTNITGFNDIAATAIVSSGAITTSGGAVSTVTTVTNQLTAAAIATGIWQDSTAGDFTTASSVGKSLYNAFTSNTSVFTTASLVNAPTGGSAPTAAAIATAVWQDSTAGDFTTASSIGKSLYNAFTSNTSVYTTAALANGPSGSGPTAAAIATAVWQDTTAGDFTTASSIGKSLYTAGVVPGGSGGLFIAGSNAATTVNFTGNLSGSVGSVTGAVGSVTGNVGGSVASVTGSVASVTGAVGSVTGNVGGSVGGSVTGSVASVTAAVTVSGASALAESYPAVGGPLTLSGALYTLVQLYSQQTIAGTTMTVLKRDQSTTAKTYTLNSSTAPTAITEAS